MITAPHIAMALALALSLQGIALPALAEQGPALAVADGKPWNATGPGGRKIKMTFFPNGKARMQMGIMAKSFSWQATGDGFCLKGLPGGGKCVRLEPSATGYVGYEGDTPSLQLNR